MITSVSPMEYFICCRVSNYHVISRVVTYYQSWCWVWLLVYLILYILSSGSIRLNRISCCKYFMLTNTFSLAILYGHPCGRQRYVFVSSRRVKCGIYHSNDQIDLNTVWYLFIFSVFFVPLTKTGVESSV